MITNTTKEQVIEILEKALANPNYLDNNKKNQYATHWFCSSVEQVLCARYSTAHAHNIKNISRTVISDHIFKSINGCLFLKTHLCNIGSIPYGTYYRETAYKVAAHAHWRALIDKLKSE